MGTLGRSRTLLAPPSRRRASRRTSVELCYRVWTADDGLPRELRPAIDQTPDSYIWIATLDGLVRFDGVRMTSVQPVERARMTSNRILACASIVKAGSGWERKTAAIG
jgi:hypothetical protein